MSLPLVTPVGVNSLTATGANLVGSVNPQGNSGTYWFAYGTTTSLGTTTPSQNISATSQPQTVTASLTGLTTGTPYYFAVVCSTGAGTVTSAQLTFTPAVPTTATALQPAQPQATAAVTTPHTAYPFQVDANGVPKVVEQDTLEEVYSSVQAILACQRGQCPEIPTLGIPDLSMAQGPVDTAPLVAAVQAQEPRAQQLAASGFLGDPNLGNALVSLTTTYAGSGQ